jgi:hypothetical protein
MLVNYNFPDFQMTAAQLCADYDSNEIAADKKYEDKYIQISGEIQNISKVYGQPLLYIGDSQFIYVMCYMDKNQESLVAKTFKGQPVIITGRCSGKSLLGNPCLQDCQFYERPNLRH